MPLLTTAELNKARTIWNALKSKRKEIVKLHHEVQGLQTAWNLIPGDLRNVVQNQLEIPFQWTESK